MESIAMWALAAIWSAIVPVTGWFFSVLSKDVKSVLINQEKLTANLQELSRDAAYIRHELSEHNKRISHIETSLAKMEEWKRQF